MSERAMNNEPPAADDRAREDRERYDRLVADNAHSTDGDTRHREAMTAIRNILGPRTVS